MKSVGVVAAVAALAANVEALIASSPRATGTVELPLDGMSPRPTAPPGIHDLRRRAGSSSSTTVYFAPDETCGFISGRVGAAFTCAPDAQCVFFTAESSIPGAIACCNTATCAGVIDCIDRESFFSSSACDNGCLVDHLTMKCTDTTAPYCNTISFSSNIIDYWCNNEPITGFQSATTAYSGQSGRQFSPLVLSDTSSSLGFSGVSDNNGPTVSNDPIPSSTSTASASASGGGNGNGGDSNSGDNSSDNNNNNGDNKSSGGGKSTNTGAIAGGVVGGVAAIGLGALGLFFFFRNKKKKQAAKESSPSSYNAQMQQSPPPPQGWGQQGQQGYYNQQPGPNYNQGYPPQNQYAPPPAGGYYPNQQPSPDPVSATSPTMSHADPRMSAAVSSTSPAPSSTPTPVVGSAHHPSGGFQPQQGVIHEAPTSASEQHRGEMHELG